MAHKKGAGSTKNGRDSPGQRLGVKIFGGQLCNKSNILIRQRGSTWHAGENVGTGRDYTLYAKTDGIVHFHKDYVRKRKYVSVKPFANESVDTTIIAESVV